MKIAQLYPYPAPIGENVASLRDGLVTGGGETYPYRLSLKLAEQGHQVTFFTGRLPGIKQDRLCIGNLEVVYYPTFRRESVQYSFSPKLLAELLKGDYDVFHAHQLPTMFSMVAGIAGKLKGKKVIYHYEGFRPDITTSVKILSRINSALCTNLIVPNEYSGDFFKGYIVPDKIRVISYGIDTQYYQKKASGKKTASVFAKESNAKYLLYVGRLIPSKGIDTIIRSLPLLIQQGLNVKLVIVGQGYFKDYLEKLAQKLGVEDRVIFSGFIPDEDLPEFYSAADIFILPSVYYDCFNNYHPEPEAFGLVLAEAMSCGTPTIATNVAGVPYWIKDGYNGLLYESGDEKGLASRIISLIEDTHLRTQIINNAFNELKEKHSLNLIAERILELYGEG